MCRTHHEPTGKKSPARRSQSTHSSDETGESRWSQGVQEGSCVMAKPKNGKHAESKAAGSKKKRDYSKFKELARIMQAGEHRTREGIERVLEIRRDMNDGGKRRYSDEDILGRLENPQRPYAGQSEQSGG